MKHVSEENDWPQIKCRDLDPSTHSSCDAVTHSLLEMNGFMTEIRLQGLSPCKTEDMRAQGRISHERYHAGVERRIVAGHKEMGISDRDRIDYLR
jgi:uncharacterized protein YqfB (UPF0267 family)